MNNIPTLTMAALQHVDIVAATATRKLTEKEKLAELQHDASMLRSWSDLLMTQHHVGAHQYAPTSPHRDNTVGVTAQAEAHARVDGRPNLSEEIRAWRNNYELRSPQRETPKSTHRVRLTDPIYCRTILAR